MSEALGGGALELRAVSISYGGRTVLRDVDLDLRAGRVTALVGPSGCGKTSLLSCLNRMTDLVPGCEVHGEVRLDGELLGPRTDVSALRRRVGMVFQAPNPFALSIEKNLALPLREHGTPRAEVPARIERVLRRVGLWDEVRTRLASPALDLSGGQQQRLCIARALTLEPSVLLMDEPCSALDPLAGEAIERLIAELRGRVTVVIVTHNLAQALRVADDVAVFWVRDGVGQLIEAGPAARVFASPQRPETAAYLHGERG